MSFRLFRIVFTIVLLALFSITMALGQSLEKTPKDYAIHLSLNHHLRLPFSQTAKDGIGIELDHSWQLSGYQGGRKAFITVPLGYKYFIPRESTTSNSRSLYYGWKVRHEWKRGNPRWQPFLGYALLLNQLWIEGVEGNIIGHETRFTLGMERNISTKFAYILSLDYSYIRFPQLGIKKAPKSMEVALKFGIRIK